MTTSVISNIVMDLSNVPVPNAPVVIDLVPGPSWRSSDASELFQVAETKSDATGLWSVPLERSSNLDPPTSYYRVREMLSKVKGGTKTWFFNVPDFDCRLHDCLTTPSATNALIRPVVVTSNTRPQNPYVGMQIFETDTGRVLYWYGSTLGWRQDWGIAWGEIVGIPFLGDFTTTSTVLVDVTGCTTGSYPIVQGRQYVTILSFWAEITGVVGTATFAVVNTTGTIINNRDILPSGVPFIGPVEMYIREAAVAANGTAERKVQVKVSAATVSFKVETDQLHPVTLSVRDVGPQANPGIT